MGRSLCLGIALAAACSTPAVKPRPDGGPISPPADATACVPRSCDDLDVSCGEVNDGCGHMITCDTCAYPSVCGGASNPNACAVPPAERPCTGGWCWEAPDPIAFVPSKPVALAADDAWIVGAAGTILHFDGSHWMQVPSGTTADLKSVWMASPSDGWAVGTAGTILRWNGTAWAPLASGTTADLTSVAGRSSSDVWIVGAGVTKHWTGTALESATAPPAGLGGLYETPAGELFGVTTHAIYRLLANGTWVTPLYGDNVYFDEVGGTGTTTYAVGYATPTFESDRAFVSLWDGTSWHDFDTSYLDDEMISTYVDQGDVVGVTPTYAWSLPQLDPVHSPPPDAKFFRTASAGGVLFAPTNSAELWRTDGVNWKRDGFGEHTPTTAVGTAGTSIWFGRTGGALEWSDGFIWHPVPTAPAPVVSITGTSRTDVWAIVRDGMGELDLLHFDGHGWQFPLPAPAADVHVVQLAGSSLLALGDGIYRHDPPLTGDGWSAESLAAPGVIWRAAAAVGDDVYAVGNEATATSTAHVALRHAGQWSLLPAPATDELCGVAATSASDVWVVGRKRLPDAPYEVGTISHWNGTAWTTSSPPGSGLGLCSIALVDGEIYAAGYGSQLLHRLANGTWTTERPVSFGWIDGMAATPTSVWLAGEGGAILRRDR